MFRMWGGGTYGPDCFYEYCSECGILLMHDFLYACGFYPDTLNSFLFEAQRGGGLSDKSAWPTIPVWRYGPEITRFRNPSPTGSRNPSLRTASMERKISTTSSPARCIRRTVPVFPICLPPLFWRQGEPGGRRRRTLGPIWAGIPKRNFKFSYELEAFDRMPARFSSEYGFFGAQMESTVQRYHDGEEVVRGGEIWKHHGEFDRKRNGIDGQSTVILRIFPN